MLPQLKPLQLQVVDEQGEPLAQVEIMLQSLTCNGPSSYSNQYGQAKLVPLLGAKWLSLSKTGFATQLLALPIDWPLTIQLQRQP